MPSAVLGLPGAAAFSRGLQPLLSPPSPLFPVWEKPVPSRSREGPRRTPTGSDKGRPAGGAPGPPAIRAARLGSYWARASPDTGVSGRGEPPPRTWPGESSSSGSTRACQPTPRTGSQGQPPRVRLLGAQALGSTLQIRKLRPFSYKWQMGLGLEPGLPAPSLHQAGRWTGCRTGVSGSTLILNELPR